MKPLFSTFVDQGALKLDPKTHAEIKRTALKLHEIDEEGVAWCKKNYPMGYTSYSSLCRLHEQFSVFSELKVKLDRKVKSYANKLGLQFDTGSLEISTLWVNVMPKHCYHAFHIHPLSVVSGTYYVAVDGKTSPLRIQDPRQALFMACPPRPIQIDLKPKKGDFILFESWMNHEVPPNLSEETRVSVSFNYDWVNR